MKSFILYVALVVFIDFTNAKSLKAKIFRERRAPTLNGQSNGNAQCPPMCVRWNTVLKENGQMENTPIVTSPLVPGDTITQCPKQCDPKCCNTAGQTSQVDASQELGGLQDQLEENQNHPPACMEGCPKACYPACRPGCCNGPSTIMSMYQQTMGQQTPMIQPVAQQYLPQPTLYEQARETIPRPDFYSYASQTMDNSARDIIPTYAQPVTSNFLYPSSQYSVTSQTRATIPQPVTSYNTRQPASQRTKVSQSTSIATTTCPIPCSPMCAPHCTKHCCESYD